MKIEPFKIYLFLTLICINTFSFSASKDNQEFYNWLLAQYKSDPTLTTNQIVREPELEKFLKNNISSKELLYLGMTRKGNKDTLKNHLNIVLGGPPDRIKFLKDDIILITACRYQSCDEKGLIWIDTKKDKKFFVVISYFFNSDVMYRDGFAIIYSEDFKNKQDFPSAFWQTLENWLSSHKIQNYQIKILN